MTRPSHPPSPFCFTPENIAKAKEQLQKYPADHPQSAIKALLYLAQEQNGGWLSKDCLSYVADFLTIPPIKVMEVATFYTAFHLKPVGKYHIKICGTTPCHLMGAEDLKKTCRQYLDIGFDQTTDDSQFTLSEVECLGACVAGPVVQINSDYFECLSSKDLEEVLDALADDQDLSTLPHIGTRQHGDQS